LHTGACRVDVIDEDEGYRGGLAEPAACQAEHKDGATARELDVPGRATVGDGEPDGLGEAQDLGDPACCGSGITVEQVGGLRLDSRGLGRTAPPL
jgi:hypothetical protein